MATAMLFLFKTFKYLGLLSMINSKKIVIIGDGIAAKVLAFQIYNKTNISPYVIASEDFVPSCSLRTTSINCLRGTKKGISHLGDLIVDSYYDFVDFYNQYNSSGVEKTYELQLWGHSREKWIKRFNQAKNYKKIDFLTKKLSKNYEGFLSEAYIINPELFHNWLDLNTKKELLNDYVVDVRKEENYIIKTQNKHVIEAHKLFICSSYESNLFAHLIEDEKLKKSLEHSKPVSGSYLKFNLKDFDANEFNCSKSFSLVFDNIHIVYRPFSNDVLIGSTSTNNSKCFTPDKVGINSIYEKAKEHLKGSLNIPPLEKAEILTGIRHKGQRRTPFWGEINTNCYAIWGLYKNGFTYCFKAASDILKHINANKM